MKKIILLVASLISLVFSAQAQTNVKFDANVPADIQTQMVQDLDFVAQLTGSGQTPFHKAIYGQVDGATYAQFFETRVLSIGLDSCGGGMAVACVQPFFYPKIGRAHV